MPPSLSTRHGNDSSGATWTTVRACQAIVPYFAKDASLLPLAMCTVGPLRPSTSVAQEDASVSYNDPYSPHRQRREMRPADDVSLLARESTSKASLCY